MNKKFYEMMDNEDTRKAMLVDIIRKKYPEGSHILSCRHVFGEDDNNTGFVEEVIKPLEGGTYLRFYGCGYLWKGFTQNVQLWGTEFPKSVLFQIPRKCKSKLFLLVLGFYAVFYRQWLLDIAAFIFAEIRHKVVRHYAVPERECKIAVQAIRRAGIKAINAVKPRTLTLLLDILAFLCLFLELDSAYWFRVQDAFGGLKDKSLEGFFACLEIMMARENEKREMVGKLKYIKLALKALFWLEPQIAEVVRIFILEMDWDTLAMDEADWYFSLGYISYNFGGKSVEERKAERKQIDEERGHILLFA